jgi:glycosyltransferase involved in cell wall biosynthesis
VTIDAEDAVGLAKSLRELASNRDRRKHMGQTAREIAEGHTWSSKAQSYVNLFEMMANSSISN